MNRSILQQRVNAHWQRSPGRPRPPTHDCIGQALQQAGQLYTPNNPAGYAAQVADLGYLILSALAEIIDSPGQAGRCDAMLARVYDRLAWAMLDLEQKAPAAARAELAGAADAWINLCDQCGWKPADLIDCAIKRIEAGAE